MAFQSETAEAYHALKHQTDLPPEFRPAGGNPVDNYEAAINDVVKTGRVVAAEPTDTGSTMVVIQKTYPSIGADVKVIIYVKPDGTPVIATLMKA